MKIKISSPDLRSPTAFTLLEVMVAIGIFFIATFAILDLVNQNLKAAALLNRLGPTAGMVAAELSMTNQLSEGTEQGDFGELYPDYSWMRDTRIWLTNGMYQVDIVVMHKNNIYSKQTILLFRPDNGPRPGAAN